MNADPRQEWLNDAIARWEKPLLRLCFSYLCDTALAEDAVQETFFKAWKNYGCFRGEAGEKTWLMRIAVNTCKDYRRTAWFRHIDRKQSLEELPPQLLSVEPKDETLTLLVMELPDRYKQVILLYYFQGLTMQETADALGSSQPSVQRRLKQAEALLKTSLTGGEAYEG